MKISFAVVGVIASAIPLCNGFQFARPLSTSGRSLARPMQLQSTSGASADSKADDNDGDEKTEVEKSAALKWAAKQKEELEKAAADTGSQVDSEPTNGKKKKYVVVGAGWGGWGAAKVRSQQGLSKR